MWNVVEESPHHVAMLALSKKNKRVAQKAQRHLYVITNY
jgi:hypothetical protein